MSKPPDEVCICALTTKAYPEFTDQQVIDVCQAHWAEIVKMLPSPVKVGKTLDSYLRHYGLSPYARRAR